MTTVQEASAVTPTGATDIIDSTPSSSFTTGIVGLIAVGLALISATITFVVLSGLTRISPTHYVVVTLLLVNALTVLVLLGIIGRDVWQIVQARRRGRAGSRLHVQIVGLFSVIAAVPAILIAVVASVTLDRGLDRFFSVRNRIIIENSLNVAQAYLREHAQTMGGDIMAMAFELTRFKQLYDQDREKFRQVLTAQASLRRLSATM